MTEFSRVDLHVHTRFSSNAGDWLLSKIGARESYTTPEQVVEMATQRGMDWVTISDHDTIDGALQMAHLPNFFISEEISAYFPEDKTRIHVVALNITEKQHTMIQLTRADVYELVDYLNSEDIVHFVAHPFFRMTEQLTLSHFEKMLLLFKRFEVKNGGKQIDPDDFLIHMLDRLTPDKIWGLADKYKLNPIGHNPWEKFKVAGSDDHGGIHIGSPYTQCPKASTIQELMTHFRTGKTETVGQGGTHQTVAHAIMAVSYKCLESNRESVDPLKSNLAWNLLGQILDNTNSSRSLSDINSLLFKINRWFPGSDQWPAWLPALPMMVQVFNDLIKQDPEMIEMLKSGFEFYPDNNQKLYDFNKQFIHQLLQRMGSNRENASIKSIFKHLSVIITISLPYLIAYKTEYRDRPLIRQVKQRYGDGNRQANAKIAVFADYDSRKTARSRLLNLMLQQEFDQNIPVQVLGIGENTYHQKNYQNIQPLTQLEIQGKRHAFPSILEIGEWLFKDDYDTLYLHSLGPMGILGFCLGKWMGMKVIGRFSYLEVHSLLKKIRTGHAKFAKQMLSFLFRQMDQICVSSKEARDLAIELNIHPSKIMFVGASMETLFADGFLGNLQTDNSFNQFQPFKETNQRTEQ